MTPYDISVVIPLYNEERNIERHFEQINNTLSELNRTFEIIFVNDGSTDNSEEILQKLYSKYKNVITINLYRKKGKAAALEVGIEFGNGEYVVIIDADLQYDARDIPAMISELDKGYDLVSGKRSVRGDPRDVVIASQIFNMIMRRMTGLNFVDYFSGLKCFKRNVINYLSLYGDLYRFASVYAFKQGFKVKEIAVRHYYRSYGKSRYDFIKRLAMALLDTLTVLMTVIFNQDRVYYIGLFGLFLLSIGSIFLFIPLLLFRGQALSWYLGQTGIVMIFLGVQARLLKKMSKDFFERHQTEYFKRRSNIKNVLTHKDN